jgi:hypothetical protein
LAGPCEHPTRPLTPIHHELPPPTDCEGEETHDGTTGQTGVLRFRPA